MVGRSKDLVIRGGENVPVVEVEQLLQEHELIAGAAVVGVPDARLGEKVCAVVELKQPGTSFTFEAMSAYLLEKRLTRHFLPEYLVVLDQLPRTPSGKIRKQDARAEALQRLQQ
jgi:cyclohexanecarboxylate-CoA ligase